jgi:hypothetical protein
MCTTTDEKTRTIDELLALDTYQGMTDAEIETILDHKINQAVTEREVLARLTLQMQTSEQIIADNRRSAQEAHDMLQSIIEAEFPTVKPVEPKRFEPRSLEV